MELNICSNFQIVAVVNQEFIWELKFGLCNNFLLLSGNFRCVFCLRLKFIRCVYRELILKFVDDESDLHRGYVVVDYNILTL